MVVLGRSGPHSAPPCSLSAPEAVNLFSLFLLAETEFDRLHRFHRWNLPTCPFPSTSFGGKSNKTSAWQTSSAVALKDVCKSRGGRREAGGGLFKQKSWAECQFPSKTRVKLRWALFHSSVTQKLSQLHPAASKKSSRHLSSYQQPAEAIKLTALSTALTCTESLLGGNKHLLK